MICIKLFLFFACLFIADAERCTHATYGRITDKKYAANVIRIPPGVADSDITVDPMDKSKCPNGIVGLEVKACDGDVPDILAFTSLYKFVVHRYGAVDEWCVVSITVNC
ncbi:hypothetical protein SFRURICE_005450 [Spodoptera frugiperda]|nr:hypothetical protein SFRURICE_005450 [Spodoptera frugiperda]